MIRKLLEYHLKNPKYHVFRKTGLDCSSADSGMLINLVVHFFI